MGHDELDILEIELEYKKAVTAFLKGESNMGDAGIVDVLATVADELAEFNRNLPTLMQKMDSLRGSIDRMPHTVRMRP